MKMSYSQVFPLVLLLFFVFVTERTSYSSFTGKPLYKTSYHDKLFSKHPVPYKAIAAADTLRIFSLQDLGKDENKDEHTFVQDLYYPHIGSNTDSQRLGLFVDDSSEKFLLPGFLAQRYQLGLVNEQIAPRLLISKLQNPGKPVRKDDVDQKRENQENSLIIMGSGSLSMMQMRNFLLLHNDSIDTSYVERLTDLYIKEAEREGVNYDVAFIQMCHETDFLKYTGVVKAEQNNFCGLGTVNDHTPGQSFENPRQGIRAHIQHLKAYASKKDLNHEMVDERFFYVQRGIAPEVEELTGRWASDSAYHHKIRKLYTRLETFIEDEVIQLPI
ncbi:MAG: glucosaminidase domain-containing protein [Bacteroidales bacterium]|nr:glucosaminidase domain-containing protein [Bacteroidales bacterium]